MPPQVFLTFAKDYVEHKDGIPFNIVDVNTFNKFHTFQMIKNTEDNAYLDGFAWYEPSSVETRFKIPEEKSSGEGLILRLRSQLSSGSSTLSQQGMRVTLMDMQKGILVDATSVDLGGEGSVWLAYDDLETGVDYVLRYDLYDKELKSFDSDSETLGCSRPFITQQLLIQDKRLVTQRINTYYASSESKNNQNIQKEGLQCDLNTLNNSISTFFSEFNLESMVYCQDRVYTYQSSDDASINSGSTGDISNQVNQNSGIKNINQIYTQEFSVQGLNNTATERGASLITYWFEVVVGFNFMVSSGLKVIVSRNDHEFDKENQYSCLYDKSCAIAQMSEKNVQRLELILTTGKYKLTIFEQIQPTLSSLEEMKPSTKKVREALQSLEKPISIKIQANSIIQNEERVNCPYMYMDEWFIQHRFIEGQSGQRFTFSDNLILNAFNLSQSFYIKPEVDSYIKLKTKEAFGVNMDMRIESESGEIIAKSTQIGTTELLLYAESNRYLRKGQQYKVVLSFLNSIIDTTEFIKCPHFHLEVTMIPQAELAKYPFKELSDLEEFASQEQLNVIFNDVDDLRNQYSFDNEERSYTFINTSTIFNSSVDPAQRSQLLTKKRFYVGPNKLQFFAEIFFDLYAALGYELEIGLYSTDVKNVRTHMERPGETKPNKVDWSLYTGAKSVFMELEPGEYEFVVLCKNSYDIEKQNQNIPLQVQYQLQVIVASKIDRQQLLPASLNYFGYLGPYGKDFGQMIFFCQDCVIENSQFKIIEFQLASADTVNFEGVISSSDNSIDLRLEQVDSTTNTDQEKNTYKQQFKSSVKKGTQIGQRMSRERGSRSQEKEESVSAQKLSSNKKYRIVITVKNTAQQANKAYPFTLRLEINEKRSSNYMASYKPNLPKSIEDFARYKLKNEGVKESDFLLANLQTLQFIDQNKLHPFLLHNGGDTAYSSKITANDDDNEGIVISLPFKIETEEALVYAAIFDYQAADSVTLGLSIVKDMQNDDDDSIELISIPEKYYSQIPATALSKGDYILSIVSSIQSNSANSQIARFGLDMLIEKEDTARGYSNEIIESAMQFCGGPAHPRSLNSPSNIHPLNGNSLNTVLKMRLSDFVSEGGDSIDFKLDQNSLVQLYAEFPKDVHLQAQILKGYNIVKAAASWDKLNSENDNFLKVKDYKTKNIISLRQILKNDSTNYRLALKGTDDILTALERCDSFTVSISIFPILPEVSYASLSDTCKGTVIMGKQLEYGVEKSETLEYSLGQPIFDSSYIATSLKVDSNTGAPYMFYFQASYDQALEGPLAVALYRYVQDTLDFQEIQVSSVQDSNSVLLARLDQEGTYVVAVSSLTSTGSEKFLLDNKLASKRSTPLLPQSCQIVNYRYYMTSMGKSGSWYGQALAQDLVTELQPILPAVNDCDFDELPEAFTCESEGVDETYTLKFKEKAEDVIDVITESQTDMTLLKILIYSTSPSINTFQGFLYRNASALEPPVQPNSSLAKTINSFDEKIMLASLAPQKRAYKLKIVYDNPALDAEEDSCSLFSLRVAMKQAAKIAKENLQCTGKGLPNATISMPQYSEVFSYNEQHQISTEFLEKYAAGTNQAKDVTIDIKIEVAEPSKEYYFDIETTYDFLTGEIEGELFIQQQDKNLISLGDTMVVERHSNNQDIKSNHQSDIHKRLKADNIKDTIGQNLSEDSTYILRLTFSRLMLNIARNVKKQIKSQDPLCFNFGLSIRISRPLFEEDQYETDTDSDENELVRIDWETIQLGQLTDPSGKMSAYLEFKESVETSMNMIKQNNFIYLKSMNDSKEEVHFPQSINLSPSDKSTLVLNFAHDILKHGSCYKLEIDEYSFPTRQGSLDSPLPSQIICTTKCQSCNIQGTQKCDETKGACICRDPHLGTLCDQCKAGYIFDKKSGSCLPQTFCKDDTLNNGTEDCNGHGECYQDEETGLAQCRCETGFVNDGQDLCGKCADSMFTYPNCHQRMWMIEQSTYECQELLSHMPQYLYKSDAEGNIYQNAEGVAHWQGMFRLDDYRQTSKLNKEKTLKIEKSIHHFKVPRGTNGGVLRLFFDTHDSGVTVGIKILDQEKEQLYTSAKNDQTGSIFLILDEPEDYDNPYTLQIEYQYSKEVGKGQQPLQKCPLIEINFIIEPFKKLRSYLTCSDEEKSSADKLGSLRPWIFGYDPAFETINYTISSIQAFSNSDSRATQDENFYIIDHSIKIQEKPQLKHALSILTSYNFETIPKIRMSISNSSDEKIIATESQSYIEDVDESSSSYGNTLATRDMISVLELPNLPSGSYMLRIAIDKAYFLSSTSNSPTCLSFDLAVEHVPIHGGSHSSDENDGRIEIIGVEPPQVNDLISHSSLKIQVMFDQDINLEEVIPGGDFKSELYKLCYLEADSASEINKYYNQIYSKIALMRGKDSLELFFNFSQVSVDESKCYHLKCGIVRKGFSDISEDTNAYFDELQIKTKYCFDGVGKENQQSSKSSMIKQCNPNALPKLSKDGKCNCQFPYSGQYCEGCMKAYNANKDPKGHTVCELDQTKCSSDICNNHGSCIEKETAPKLSCKCEKAYSGHFCEYCANSTLAYPDCDPQSNMTADILTETSDKLPAYLTRKKYANEKAITSDKDQEQEQCPFTNYPMTLNRMELLGFLPNSGDFHIADFYTVNHDMDNIIRFTPRNEGVLRILIQEPEAEDLRLNDEGYDIEIAIYDPIEKSYLSTESNRYLELDQSQLTNTTFFNGKLDFAILTFKVTPSLLNRTLNIYFRALNYTDQEEEDLDACTSLYMEIQFQSSSTGDQLKTKEAASLKQTDSLVIVTSEQPYIVKPQETYSVKANSPTFFYHQEIYLGDPTLTEEQDYEFHVSIFQDFADPVLVDFMIEVLAFEVEDPVSFQKTLLQQSIVAPLCENMCLTGGQKAYNEFHNIGQLSAKTFVRLWLFKHSTSTNGLGTFQMQLQANRVKSRRQIVESLSQLTCEDMLELPETLNVDRYLGEDKGNQRNFHFLERFRVDNIKNNTMHHMRFELSKRTLMRIVAKQHRHLEFDLQLMKYTQLGSPPKSLIKSGAKGFEDTIFAELDAGTYFLKISFVSEPYFLQQPCQSIEMELAFSAFEDLSLSNSEKSNDIQPDFKKMITKQTQTDIYFKKGAVKSFNLQDKDSLSAYKSYAELYTERFSLPKLKNIGMVIQLDSDFLSADVNFALTHIQSKRLFNNERIFSGKRLIIPQLPPGDYELLIYAHQALSDLSNTNSIKPLSIDAKYSLKMNLVYWTEEDDFKQHFVMVKIADTTIKAQMTSEEPAMRKCMSEYEELPEKIESFSNDGKVAINRYFSLPEIEQSFTIKYQPSKGHEALRIIVDRPNTKIKLILNDKVLKESFSIHSGEQQVLLVGQNLRNDQVYDITIDFEIEENQEEFEISQCQGFRLQVDSFNSKKETCMSSIKPSNINNEKTFKIESTEEKTLWLELKEGTQKVSRSLQIASENPVDLDIRVDFDDLFYVPIVLMANLDSKQETKPIEVETSIQGIHVYKYSDLQANSNYQLTVIQPLKSQNCQDYVKLTLKTNSKNSNELTDNFDSTIYTSHEEIKSLNRYVEQLPVSLETLKYKRSNDYLLISEYLGMNADEEESNYFTFKIDSDDTLVKFFIETSEIYMTIKEVGGSFSQQSKSPLLSTTLKQGQYKLIFEFSTAVALKKSDIIKNTFHITIMIASPKFVNENYIKEQGTSLTNCDANANFPLALNKKTQKEALIYDYPFLRLSAEKISSNQELDRYAFRLNQTSRFFMKLGSHALSVIPQLRLADLKENGVSFVGKQEFNLNVLDIVVGSGDYALIIEQPEGFGYDQLQFSLMNFFNFGSLDKKSTQLCGLFSLSGRISPLDNEETNEQSGLSNMEQQSRCPIKETYPLKIYKSQADTKNGLEDYVNEEGSFQRALKQLLIKKSKNAYLAGKALTDNVFISPPDDGLLSIMLQYKKKGNQIAAKMMKLSDFPETQSHTEVKPLFKTISEPSHGVVESNFVFTLEKDKRYILVILYRSEPKLSESGREMCEYYNAYLSFDTKSRLQQELQCVNAQNSKQKLSQLIDLPQKIRATQFNDQYQLNKYIEIRYPKDFNKDTTLMKNIDIINDQSYNGNLELSTRIVFDYPFAMFNLFVTEEDQSNDNQSGIENIATMLPLYLSQGDEMSPSLVRELKTNQLEPQQSYQLQIQDEVAGKIMKYLLENSSNKSVEYCLYSELTLKLQQQKSQTPLASSKNYPMILSIYPEMRNQSFFKLQPDIHEIQTQIIFNSQPLLKDGISDQNGTFNPQDFSKLVSLQFFNPQTKQMVYAKEPIRLKHSKQAGNNNNFVVQATFSIKDELAKRKAAGKEAQPLVMALNLQLNRTVDSQGKPFKLDKDVAMPRFFIDGGSEQTYSIKKEEAKKVSGEIDLIKQQIENVTSDQQPTIKCICVDGTCKEGERNCNRCDYGWSGVLCDIPTSKEKMNVNSENKQRKYQQGNSRLGRDKSSSDYNYEQPMESHTTSMINKYYESNEYSEQTMKHRGPGPQIGKQINYNNDYTNARSPQINDTDDGFFSTLFSYALNLFYLICGLGITIYLGSKIMSHYNQRFGYIPVTLQDDNDQPTTELQEFHSPPKKNQRPINQDTALQTIDMPMNTQSLHNYKTTSNTSLADQLQQPQNQQKPYATTTDSHQTEDDHHIKMLTTELQLFSNDDDQEEEYVSSATHLQEQRLSQAALTQQQVEHNDQIDEVLREMEQQFEQNDEDEEDQDEFGHFV